MILYSCIENNQKEFLPGNFYMLFCKVKKVVINVLWKTPNFVGIALKKSCHQQCENSFKASK